MLKDEGRLDLTMEALALKPEYAELFTDAERTRPPVESGIEDPPERMTASPRLAGAPMLTLGVDLSTEAKRTAACLVRWPPGEAGTVVEPMHPASDGDIVSLAAGAAATGIDAPFGWPRLWAKAVSRHVPGSQFEADGTPGALTRRATDHWIGQQVRSTRLPSRRI